jgi:hypothetical protein
MILRDPQGGKSYASYKNVATTIKVTTAEFRNEVTIGVESVTKTVAEKQFQLCMGAGFGAIVLLC